MSRIPFDRDAITLLVADDVPSIRKVIIFAAFLLITNDYSETFLTPWRTGETRSAFS